MERYTVGGGSRSALGGFGVLFVAVGAVGASLLWQENERVAALALALGAAAIAGWAFRELWRSSRRSWALSEDAIEQHETGAEPTRLRWEDVAAARFSSLRSSLRLRGRDGRRFDVPYVVRDFPRLVVELERALNRERTTALPLTIAPRSTRGARWTLAAAVSLGCVAAIPPLAAPDRIAALIAASVLGCAGLAWWVLARNVASFVLDAERLTVRQGWSTEVFELGALRGWAVGFLSTQWGAGHPCLWLTTDDDAWAFVVPSERWLELASAIRTAAALHPHLEWLVESLDSEENDVEAPPAPAERRARRWPGLALFAAATLMLILVGAATSASPGASPLERAQMAMTARRPALAIEELTRWLDQHPHDLEAHRALVDAHLARLRSTKPCCEQEARARYETLRASEDALLAEIGAWGLARIEGACGDRERAIGELGDIDAGVIPHAPVDRARLLSAAGRSDEAARALRGALDGPAGEDAAAVLAWALVEQGAEGERAATLRELGPDVGGGAPARVMAARSLRASDWVALHAHRASRTPLPLLAALVFMAVWVWAARFWGGALAPSPAASFVAASAGAGIFVIEAFASDLLGADLRAVPVSVLARVVLPFSLALAWSSAAPSTPLGLVSRAGCISAGATVGWALGTSTSSGFDLAVAWSLLPAAILLAPWASLWFTDLRARGWSSLWAGAGALALASIPGGAMGTAAVLWPSEVGFLLSLVLLIAVALTFQPLLANAAVLSREPGHAAPRRRAAFTYLKISVVVLSVAWFALTRTLTAPLALRAMVTLVGLAAITALPIALGALFIVDYPRWRRDWWRERPG